MKRAAADNAKIAADEARKALESFDKKSKTA